MNTPTENPPPGTINLSTKELNLLRFTCDLYAGEESPLVSKNSITETQDLQTVAQGLVDRDLVQAKTFRPARELLRRLLIASQPDARVVLMRSELQTHEALFEAYERANVYMPYQKRAGQYWLGEPIDEEDVFKRINRNFSPRGAQGDLISLNMSLSEYFVFSALAGDLKRRKKKHSERVIAGPTSSNSRAINHVQGRGPSVVISSTVDDDGTPIRGMLRDMPPELGSDVSIPSVKNWEEALDRLIEADIVVEKGNRHSLRPYLHDLADGLTSQRRYILTRFDFVMEDWIVRDASFVTVPGSVFKLQAGAQGRMAIQEMSQSDFTSELWRVMSDPTPTNQ
jgi:hypothetical protein